MDLIRDKGIKKTLTKFSDSAQTDFPVTIKTYLKQVSYLITSLSCSLAGVYAINCRRQYTQTKQYYCSMIAD